MNLALIFVIIFFVIALGVLIVHFFASNALNSALGSLIAILASMIGSLFAPSLEGAADVNLHFGSFGSITAHGIKANSPTPVGVWCMAFIVIGFLTGYVLFLIKEKKG